MDYYEEIDGKLVKLSSYKKGKPEYKSKIDAGQVKLKSGNLIVMSDDEVTNLIADRTEAPEQKKFRLKQKLHEDMDKTTVEINGKVFWADPGSEQNFSGRIREMKLNGRTSTKWAQGLDVFEATLEELEHVVAEGTKKNAALWDAYIIELEKL